MTPRPGRVDYAPYDDEEPARGFEPNGSITEPPMTTQEIARFLGTSADVARNLMRTNKLSSFKIGGQWRSPRGAVAAYIADQLNRR